MIGLFVFSNAEAQDYIMSQDLVVEACEGTIYDSGGASTTYTNSEFSTMLIQPGGSNLPALTFSFMAIETNYDGLSIYDGSDASGFLLGYYELNDGTVPNGGEPIIGYSGSLYLTFTSDGSVTYDGFEATLSCISLEDPPIAQFTSDLDPNGIDCDGSIQFSDLSLLGPTSWAWDFGDGNTSTEQNPLHTYIVEGVYTVTLEACNDFGCQTFTATDYITFEPSNAECFKFPMPNNGEVTFVTCTGIIQDPGEDGPYFNNMDGFAVIIPDDNAFPTLTFTEFAFETNFDSLYIWDGNSTDGILVGGYSGTTLPNNGEMIISQSGAFYLYITSDGSVTFDGFTAEIGCVAADQPPIPNFTTDVDVISCDGAVQFNDVSLLGPNAWNWDFGDGNTSTEQSPLYTYTTEGVYDVTLEACNEFGCESLTLTAIVNFDSDHPACFSYNAPQSDGIIIEDCQGTIHDSGGPDGNYIAGESGIVIIQPGGGLNCSLTFTQFDLVTFQNDVINVYDGIFPEGTLLGSFAGNTLPNGGEPFISTQGGISIEFVPDIFAFSTAGGYAAQWQALGGQEPPIAAFSISDLNPPYGVAVDFIDESLNEPGSYDWSFSNGAFSSEANPSIGFTTPGEISVSLQVSNCGGSDTAEPQTFEVQTPPQAICSDDTIFVTAETGDIIDITSVLGNFPLFGAGDLAYNLSDVENALAGFNRILVYDWGIQDETTYTTPIEHIDEAVPFSNIFNSNAQTPEQLALDLESMQVMIVLAHESDLNENLFTDFQDVLEQFVLNGNTVIFLGQSNINGTNDPNVIFNSGLFNGLWIEDPYDSQMSVIDDTHPIAEGIESPFTGQVSTTSYNITDDDAQTIVGYQGTDILSIRENIGPANGKAVFLGFNYAYANQTQLNLLDNVVTWAASGLSTVQWLFTDNPDGIVTAGTFGDVDMYIDVNGVPGGQYVYDLSIYTNDPDNSECIQTIVLDVIGVPQITLNTDTLDFGNVVQFTEESLIFTIFNTGNETLTITDIQIGNPYFTFSQTPTISILPNLPSSIVLTYNPQDIEFLDYIPLTIFTNDPENPVYTIYVIANATGAPQVQANPSPVEITLNAGEAGIAPFNIFNGGQGDLEYCMSVACGTDGFLFSFSTDFFPTEFSWQVVDSEGNFVIGVDPGFYTTQNTPTVELLGGLTPGEEYTLQLFDTFGDGGTQGEIQIIDPVSGDVVATGNFDNGSEAAIFMGSPSPSWLTFEEDACGTIPFPAGDFEYDLNISTDGLIGGTYNCEIIINSNDPINPVVTVPVTLTVVGIPEINVDATELDFGDIIIGNTNTLTFTVTNTGTDVLTIDDLLSDFPGVYDITVTNNSLEVGESATVTVTFIPNEIQDFDGTMTIVNNDENIVINIFGTGLGAPVVACAPSPIEVTLLAGECETQTITLSNSGEGDMIYNITFIEAGGDGVGFQFDFTLDFFPTEFSWSITDESGATVASTNPGDYTIQQAYTEVISGLSLGENYTLNFFDTFGDGALDAYTVTDLATGAEVISGDWPTGSTESHVLGSPFSPAPVTIGPDLGGNLGFPADKDFTVEICATGLTAAIYENNICFETNDPITPECCIPVILNVIAFPQAAFSADNDAVVCGEGVDIQFTDESVNVPTNWLWDFGDGNTSTEQNPIHVYTQSGNFDVTLTVSNDLGENEVVYQNFIVVDLNCIDEEVPNTGIMTVTGCNGTLSDSGGPDAFYLNNSTGGISIYAPGAASITITFDSFDMEVFDTLYIYDGPDATSPLIGSFNNNNPIFNGQQFTSSGEYLTIIENTDGITGLGYQGYTATFACEAPEEAPVANFEWAALSSCGGDMQFTDLSTNFANEWLWDFGDGTGTSNQQNPVYTYSEGGTYTVSLTATNGFGTNTITFDVDVVVLIADITIPEIILVDEQFIINGNNVGASYQWDFGNGTTSFATNPLVTYTEAGDYTITVTVTDFNVAADCTTTFETTVTALEDDAIELVENHGIISVYPNPSNQHITIEYDLVETDHILIDVRDIAGREIWSGVVEEHILKGKQSINVSAWANGLYNVTISSEQFRHTQQITVQH